MLGFDYNRFKAALKKVEEENNAKLLLEVQKVKVFVEKALTLCLESSANLSRTSYPGIEL